MAVTIVCPRLRCRAILRVPDEVRGKQVRCSECGMTFIVPTTANSRPMYPKPSQTPAKGQRG